MKKHINHSPVADTAVLNTSILMSFEEGLLETNSSCINPSSSFVLYVDWLKLTTNAAKEMSRNQKHGKGVSIEFKAISAPGLATYDN